MVASALWLRKEGVMQYLLIGGPAHGTEREVDDGQEEVIVMAPSPDNPLPQPHKYVLKTMQAMTRPGMVFRRTLLVEQGMPIEIASQALGAVLMQRFAAELLRQFMEGGELVNGDEERKSDSGDRDVPETRASGLLVAKH
jgi:hypothetical protein